jgi:hypothetical protein
MAEGQRTRESVENELAVKAFQDPAFMEALRASPREVIAKEYGLNIPPNVKVELIEESPTKLYLRLPPNPNDLELTDEQLEAVAGGECAVTTAMVSTTVAATIATTTVVSQEVSTRHGGW